MAHKKKLGAVLHTGVAQGHHGNPAASLRVNQIYGLPVLLSGLGALVFNKSEKDIINQHHKTTLQKLMRLHDGTPPCVVAFLGGSLPGKALLHLRQLSLFGMVTRLQGNIIHRHANNVLLKDKLSSRSWFLQIRELCIEYNLPHPLVLLEYPLSKSSYKNMVNKAVVSFWESKLRAEAAGLLSLEFFRPQFMSLTTPHPMWLTARSSPYEVIKATVQAKMLSGRYRTEKLCSHWSQNKPGYCLLPSCAGQERVEDIAHILISCPSLCNTRSTLTKFTSNYSKNLPEAASHSANQLCSSSHPLHIQFLLDCSTMPSIISLVQQHGSEVLFHMYHKYKSYLVLLSS
jgi:hypothetical protein